jgi:GT2 family glycosyltransferase
MKKQVKSSKNLELKTGITVVVVTYCRPNFLNSILGQLNNQTILPAKIIVVDNDVNRSAKNVVNHSRVTSKKIEITYVPNVINSLSIGRNLGVSLVETEFTCLLDDDVVVPNNYLERVILSINDLKDAIGIQGILDLGERSKIKNFMALVTGDFYISSRECRVRWSISTAYPKYSGEETPLLCEWISGTNQFYRTHVIKEVTWDENLIKYCDGEDLDHSLRVSRSGLGYLYLLPNLPLNHLETSDARVTGYKNVLMRESYAYYLLHKLFPNKKNAQLFFVWSRISTLSAIITKIIYSKFSSESVNLLRNYLNALYVVFKNKIYLQNGNLGRINKSL